MRSRILSMVIMMSLLIPAMGQIYHVGDLYTAEDGSQGIVYYVHPDGSGWIVALHDVSSSAVWGIQDDDVPGLANTLQTNMMYVNCLSDTAGYTNTTVLRAYQNNNPNFAASMVDLENGWYIPSASQLSMLYAQLPFMEDKIIAAGGSTLAYDTYMSSTECNAVQFISISFSNDPTLVYLWGAFTYRAKNDACHLRAVRSLHPLQNTYDTTLLYTWNNGVTEPHFHDAPQQTTTYAVTVTSSYGCTNTGSVAVTVVNDEPQTLFDTVCRGTEYNDNGFSLTATETDTVGEITRTMTVSTGGCESEVTLQLSLLAADSVTFSQQACQSFEWNGTTYTEGGSYTQHFTNVYGCDSVVTMDLTLENIDIGIVTSGDFCSDASLELLVETDVSDYVWSTGAQTPQITVMEPGVYGVTGTQNGCIDSARIVIEPCESAFYLPNAFTPNDDSENPVFLPVFSDPGEVEEYRMEIYNRWGTLVFRTEEKSFGWDGANATVGVYAVVVHYRTRGEKPKTVTGSVTVVR